MRLLYDIELTCVTRFVCRSASQKRPPYEVQQAALKRGITAIRSRDQGAFRYVLSFLLNVMRMRLSSYLSTFMQRSGSFSLFFSYQQIRIQHQLLPVLPKKPPEPAVQDAGVQISAQRYLRRILLRPNLWWWTRPYPVPQLPLQHPLLHQPGPHLQRTNWAWLHKLTSQESPGRLVPLQM